MNGKVGYSITWEAGASAQIELFSPELDAKSPDEIDTADYRFKFTPPMRRTIRPPLEGLQLGTGELVPITDSLNKLVTAFEQGRGAGSAGAAANPAITDAARKAGGLLFRLVIPEYVQSELAGDGLFLEIGVDEALLDYPWELLHDGTEFLCLKHSMGRFVNVSRPVIPGRVRPENAETRPLSILIISVPRPQPRENKVEYAALSGVDKETEAIIRKITDMGGAPKLLAGSDATWANVAEAIRGERFHIVHYSGHAYFDNKAPMNSSLVLYNSDMTTGQIRKLFGSNPPVMFFVNGCESAAATGTGDQWKKRYDIFGLARGFLETGAYLLGSRWKIGDDGAAKFAESFYANLLEEKPLGRTIRDARLACRAALPDDFSWASYIYYGDPRVRFRKVMM
jgi:hypothetical protein